jgi:hypothetical protein
VVALLAVAMLAASYGNPVINVRPRGPAVVEEMPVFTLAPPPTNVDTGRPAGGGDLPGWVGIVVLSVGVAFVLVIVGLLIRLFLRNGRFGRSRTVEETTPTPSATQTARRVWDVLNEGLSDLDEDESDPRRVVIACWVRLEEAAAAAGFGRAAGDTSTELVTRLLAATQVSAAVLAPFAAVYREARFAEHVVDIQMRDQARAALSSLRDELALGAAS